MEYYSKYCHTFLSSFFVYDRHCGKTLYQQLSQHVPSSDWHMIYLSRPGRTDGTVVAYPRLHPENTLRDIALLEDTLFDKALQPQAKYERILIIEGVLELKDMSDVYKVK